MLRFFIGWMAWGTIFKVTHLNQGEAQSAEGLLGSLLFGLVCKFVFGAFWSHFFVVYAAARVAGVVFTLAVVVRGRYSNAIAKCAFAVIMFLSLFCIWAEPWLTLFGIVFQVLLIFLFGFSVLTEICLSIAWIILLGGDD